MGTSAFFTRIDADGQGVLLPALESEARQLRLLLEGRAGEGLGGVEGLSGDVEVAARLDGGDAESGVGVELGGGVGYGRADLGLALEASGRMLLAHEEEGLEDAGVSLSLAFDPGERGRGGVLCAGALVGEGAGRRAVGVGRAVAGVGCRRAGAAEFRARLHRACAVSARCPHHLRRVRDRRGRVAAVSRRAAARFRRCVDAP